MIHTLSLVVAGGGGGGAVKPCFLRASELPTAIRWIEATSWPFGNTSFYVGPSSYYNLKKVDLF